MKTFRKIVKNYTIEGKVYIVYGCWDDETEESDLDQYGYDFYDVDDSKGDCINLGNPLFKIPTLEDMQMLLKWFREECNYAYTLETDSWKVKEVKDGN